MSDTQPVGKPGLEGSMFLFTKPALLNKEQHGNKGVTRPERPFAFAENIRAVPLTLSEVPSASRHYPVIFSEASSALPLAVVGIIDDENLFIEKDGTWAEHVYVPGYLRRYPFALANDRNSAPDNQRMAMIVDEGYEGVQDDGELKFFNPDGQPSDAMKQAMEYCQTYERDRQMTMQFSQELLKYDILAEQVAQFTPDGAPQPMPFAKYIGVEENRLAELSDEKYLQLRKSNILPILYAQLMSMGNWRSLMERRAQRHELKGEDVLKSLKAS